MSDNVKQVVDNYYPVESKETVDFHNIVVINHQSIIMNSLQHTIEDFKLFEAIADIAFIAGQKGFFSGDSRADIAEFIKWAKEFEVLHEDTNWDDIDYINTLEVFTAHKMRVDLQ